MSGLVKDKDAILNSLDSVSALPDETSDLAIGIRPSLVQDVKGLRQVATNLNKGRGEIDRALQILPIKLNKIGRTAIYGSFFNFYLCEFKGNVIAAGRRDQKITYDTSAPAGTRGATSDERPLPRAQPGHDRCHQHRRDPVADPDGLQGRRPAADRWRRHLLRLVLRRERPQAQRRGPHRRRPRRQGHQRRPRRQQGQRHLQGQDPLEVRHQHRGPDQGQDPARRDVPLAGARGRRPAQGGQHDPDVAHQVGVRRGRGVLRPGRRAPRRSTSSSCRPRSTRWPT